MRHRLALAAIAVASAIGFGPKVGNREYLKYGFVCPSTGHLRRR